MRQSSDLPSFQLFFRWFSSGLQTNPPSGSHADAPIRVPKCQLFLTWSMMTLWYVSSWYSWRFRNPANSPVQVGSCFPFIYGANYTSQVVVWSELSTVCFDIEKNENPFQKGTHIFKLWILKCQGTSIWSPFFGAYHLVDWRPTLYQIEPQQKSSYFPLNPGWSIGILIMVYYNFQYNWVVRHPLYNPKQPGALFSWLNGVFLTMWSHPHL